MTNHFILRNPSQIKKHVVGADKKTPPAEIIEFESLNANAAVAAVCDALSRISAESRGDIRPTVFVLSRYSWIGPYGLQELNMSLSPRYPELSISCMTIHSSKGLTSDYVVIANVNADAWGFPSEKQDDRLLNMVLSKREDFPYAEERRVMYVAMTRASKKIFITYSQSCPSSFVLELKRWLAIHHPVRVDLGAL